MPLDTQGLTMEVFIEKHNSNIFNSNQEVEDSWVVFEGPDFRTPKAKKEENESVDEFQKTGNMEILEQIYKNRIPSLKWWANKNKYLDNNSFDDIFGELTKIFVRAIYSYKYMREKKTDDGKIKLVKTPFNSYLYSAFENSMCNIHNKKKAKKRCPININPDELDSISDILLSLNFSYGSGESQYTLQDVIPDEKFGMDGGVVNDISFKETVSMLCQEDDPGYIQEVFMKLGDGSSLASIIKEYKSKTGKLKISNYFSKKIKEEKSQSTLRKLIKNKHKNNFDIIDYEIDNGVLKYHIEFHKTEETEFIIKKIRGLRKNKDTLLKKINVI